MNDSVGPKTKLRRVVGYVPLDIELEIEQLARQESRTASNMIAVLVVEALEQRDRKTKRAATLERRATKGETGDN